MTRSISNALLIILIECPPPNALRSGGFHCKDDKCINDNKGYEKLETAWHECKKVPECQKISKWKDAKFYLRRADDIFDSDIELSYVDFGCSGNINKQTFF